MRQKSFHFPDEGLAVFRKIPSGGAKQLYSTGELVIHHKQGARKYYALARDYIPQRILKAPDPIPDESAHGNGGSCAGLPRLDFYGTGLRMRG